MARLHTPSGNVRSHKIGREGLGGLGAFESKKCSCATSEGTMSRPDQTIRKISPRGATAGIFARQSMLVCEHRFASPVAAGYHILKVSILAAWAAGVALDRVATRQHGHRFIALRSLVIPTAGAATLIFGSRWKRCVVRRYSRSVRRSV
jgi:hypothetical protein